MSTKAALSFLKGFLTPVLFAEMALGHFDAAGPCILTGRGPRDPLLRDCLHILFTSLTEVLFPLFSLFPSQ